MGVAITETKKNALSLWQTHFCALKKQLKGEKDKDFIKSYDRFFEFSV